MKAIGQLEELGYEPHLKGGDIELLWRGQSDPDPERVRPLLRELKARKREAVDHLQAQRIISMSLEDFSRGFLALRAWSEILNREIWLVSNDQVAHKSGLKGIIFTGEELACLLKLNPTSRDLAGIVEAKEALGCRLLRGEPTNGDL